MRLFISKYFYDMDVPSLTVIVNFIDPRFDLL